MKSTYEILLDYYKKDLSLTKKEWIEQYGYKTYSDESINERFIEKLIKLKVDFSIKTDDILYYARKVEEIIESNKFSCRVYTENRAALMGGGLFSGIGTVVGIAAAAGIAAHNLATYNPDFEIGKDLVNKKINVTYKK
ncbi:hypothetical protein ACFFHT_10355 [Gallibacterium melopsittaci]|uniref:Uncharacterized protein n=1 Tax=Gallibacterium melopsittaci TaxID=516063 RepID=A0ABV6HYM4_9PAST